MVKVEVPGGWGLVLALALGLQAVYYRETLLEAARDVRKRVLVWRTMHRRFTTHRLRRLNSLGDARTSQFMWKKGDGAPSDDSDSSGDESSGSGSSGGADATDGLMTSQKKLVLVMVGLPARGKSFVVHKATRYIEWLGFPTRMFNVGNLRRQLGKAGEDAAFFNPDNQDATQLREDMAMEVLDELIDWLEHKGHVAIFDATNTTKLRRYGLLADAPINLTAFNTTFQQEAHFGKGQVAHKHPRHVCGEHLRQRTAPRDELPQVRLL